MQRDSAASFLEALCASRQACDDMLQAIVVANARDQELSFRLGAGLARSHRACWIHYVCDQLFSFELTSLQSHKLGFRDFSVSHSYRPQGNPPPKFEPVISLEEARIVPMPGTDRLRCWLKLGEVKTLLHEFGVQINLVQADPHITFWVYPTVLLQSGMEFSVEFPPDSDADTTPLPSGPTAFFVHISSVSKGGSWGGTPYPQTGFHGAYPDPYREAPAPVGHLPGMHPAGIYLPTVQASEPGPTNPDPTARAKRFSNIIGLVVDLD